MHVEEAELRLRGWAKAHHGPSARIENLRPMPGNAGFSFGFTLRWSQGSEGLVIRVPPPGAAHHGFADVLRQADVMRVMDVCGIPVPQIRFSAAEDPHLGVPFYLATFVPGRSTHLFVQERASSESGAGLQPVFVDAIEQLARIHDVDWKRHLPGWSRPKELTEEIDAWVPTLRKTTNAEWLALGLRVRDRLHSTLPDEPEARVVHGDFYSNNWLFDQSEIRAIVDWEIAGIGSPLLDVGWLCMIYDPNSWGPARHVWSEWTPTVEFIASTYAHFSGRGLDDLDWYRALAGYRLACISARGVELHRSGKRVDPAWDILGEAVPIMFGRALDLL